MMKKLAATILSAGLLVSAPTFATTVNLTGGMTPISVGASGGASNLAIFSFSESAAAASTFSCTNGFYYIDLSTTAGRAMYNTLLAAQFTAQKIARVDFTGGSGTQCNVNLIIVNNN